MKEKKSLTWLSAVFIGFIIGNVDKFISYSWVNDGIVVIILQTIIYRAILPLITSLFIGFFIKKPDKSWFIFRHWFINYIIVAIMLIIIGCGISIDAGFKIKISECNKANQQIENQRNCIESLQNNRFNIKKIFSDD